MVTRGTVRLICIAGPTSSGKTTFATKLSMFLRNHGLRAHALTVDHYYLPLNRQPKCVLRIAYCVRAAPVVRAVRGRCLCGDAAHDGGDDDADDGLVVVV